MECQNLIFFHRAVAIVNLCEHVPVHGECPGHLMDLNFSFDHNFLIGRFQGALRRDLIEDSFLFEAG